MLRLLLGRSSHNKDRSKYQELPSVDHHEGTPQNLNFGQHDTKNRKFADKEHLHGPPRSRVAILLLKCLAASVVLGSGIHVLSTNHHPNHHPIIRKKNNISSDLQVQPMHRLGTLPTLLNVVAVDNTLQADNNNLAPISTPLIYAYSLNNPVYHRLQRAQWTTTSTLLADDEEGALIERPTLSVDRMTIAFYEPLVVSWTVGSRSSIQPADATLVSAATATLRESKLGDSSSSKPSQRHTTIPVVTDDTLIVLACSDNDDDTDARSTSSTILEAATVQQALATSRYHLGQASASVLAQYNNNNNQHHMQSDNAWFIPRFPAIRNKYCQFTLYQPIATVTDSESSAHDSETLVKVATSPHITIQSLHTPVSIHLALTSNPSEMVVNFVTGTGNNCHEVPVVEYGLLGSSSSSQRLRKQGTADTYTANDMCQAPANRTEAGKFAAPGCLQSITMDRLEPNQRYWYQVGVEGGQGVLEWSQVYDFTSAPAAAVKTEGGLGSNETAFEPFAFLAYGDQGCPSTGWTVGGEWIARMVEADLNHNVTASRPMVRMVHHIGDLSYAEGAAHIWDEWQHMIEPITTRVPYMIGVGNHEYDHTDGGINKDPSGVTNADGFHPDWGNFGNDSGGECGVPTSKRFTMPKSDTSNGVFWYSYDFANLHTVMISSEHDLQQGSQQHQWLEKDLHSVNRQNTPWVIVEMHRPLYNPETLWEQNAVGINMRYEIEDLLKEYNVDLVLAGHYHSYHRSCDGLYRDKCNNGGPTHLTIGSAGARLDEAELYPNSWTDKSILHQYGYSRITIMNASALHFEFVKVRDYNDTTSGDIGDDFWLHRYR